MLAKNTALVNGTNYKTYLHRVSNENGDAEFFLYVKSLSTQQQFLPYRRVFLLHIIYWVIQQVVTGVRPLCRVCRAMQVVPIGSKHSFV